MASSFFSSTPSSSFAAEKAESHKEWKKVGSPWLNAWHDPVASISAFSGCVTLADLDGSHDVQLLVANSNKMLKVFKGTALHSEHALLDVPTALQSFYPEGPPPRIPTIAVACTSFVFMYRGLRPFYKFSVPPLEIPVEGKEPVSQPDVVTCMAAIPYSKRTSDSESCLLIGTEGGMVHLLDRSGRKLSKSWKVKGVPVALAISGKLEVEYRIAVACRNGNIFSIKGGKVLGYVINIETEPVGLCLIDRTVVVACMDQTVRCFLLKGYKQSYSFSLPVPITNMELVTLPRSEQVKAVLLALANGEVRLYSGKHLINTMTTNDVITAMRFGPYGREEAALILCFRSGAVSIKILQRQARLTVSARNNSIPSEQDVPIPIPAKTKLFVELTQREREEAVNMHRMFQRDLCRLRLDTARSFVRLLTEKQGPLASTHRSSIRLGAKVHGLGPLFRLALTLKNTGSKAILNIPLTFLFDAALYAVEPPLFTIPLLVPAVTVSFDIQVRSLHPQGKADAIRVFVCNPRSTMPTLSAVVNMPVSELDETG